MPQQILLQPAFVLHTRAYRNTSQLVELFSKQHGRLTLVARGVKSGRQKSAAMLQPFRALFVSWSGRSELKTLVNVENDFSNPVNLRGKLLMSGYYLNELLMRLLHQHEEHETLFDIYNNALLQLTICNESVEEIEPVLRIFEKKLVAELGYGLNLDTDIHTGDQISPDRDYTYISNEGPGVFEQDSLAGVKISGKALLSLKAETFDEHQDLVACKRLMRMVLRDLLGDKPLYSRSLYNKIVIS